MNAHISAPEQSKLPSNENRTWHNPPSAGSTGSTHHRMQEPGAQNLHGPVHSVEPGSIYSGNWEHTSHYDKPTHGSVAHTTSPPANQWSRIAEANMGDITIPEAKANVGKQHSH